MKKVFLSACMSLIATTIVFGSGDFPAAGLSVIPWSTKKLGLPNDRSYKPFLLGNNWNEPGTFRPFFSREAKNRTLSYTDYLPLAGGELTGQLTLNYSGARAIVQSGSDLLVMGMWDGVNSRIESTNRPLYLTSYSDDVKIGNSGGVTMSVGATGVGIGTESANTKLTVRGTEVSSGSMKYQLNIISDVAYNASPVSGIAFTNQYNTAGNQIAQYSGITGGKENATVDNTAGYLALHTNVAGGSTTERIRISSAGYVGIGTSSPAYKLDVNGTLHTAGQSNLGGGNLYVSSDQSFTTASNYTFRDAVGINNPNGSGYAVASSVLSVGNMSNGVSLITTGNVGVGTTSPSEKLSVNGNIRTRKLIVTQLDWSDYVFNKAYKLRSLSSLESFIEQNKHLPDMPSAKEVEERGISVGDNQALLLKKIEELTLYIISQQKQIDKQAKDIKFLKSKSASTENHPGRISSKNVN